jgi:peptide-methionine (S)-S-oxide reductase
MAQPRRSYITPLLFCLGTVLFAAVWRSLPAAGVKDASVAARADADPAKLPQTKVKAPAGRQIATFAAGCFWSMEASFKLLKGVDKAEPGYAGGTVANPSYEQVCTGSTGHAETVQLTFDPKVISYRELIEMLLTTRNPTTLNRQGPDTGTQYRSVIFAHDKEQERIAREAIKKIAAAHVWKDPIVTPVVAFSNFYRAEDYHLDYYNKHPDEPYTRGVVKPEVEEFREKFKDKLK